MPHVYSFSRKIANVTTENSAITAKNVAAQASEIQSSDSINSQHIEPNSNSDKVITNPPDCDDDGES
ncbi:hypothetical protein NPIL_542601 [Nephila pilipes]|uniref:Uncharacterized protein n=1 Tax=Nephila pilipes TaxID=299642 RepID=A0A8X6NAF0_NEPPI|nr:hypothetical protein NPIL_542601 [Nephila pilipes]